MITDKQIEDALENEYDGCDKFLIVQELLIIKASHAELLIVLEKILKSGGRPQTTEHQQIAKQALAEAKEIKL